MFSHILEQETAVCESPFEALSQYVFGGRLGAVGLEAESNAQGQLSIPGGAATTAWSKEEYV